MNLKFSFLSIFLGCAVGATWMNAAITVDRMFSDGMVLQREQSVPVWGTLGSIPKTHPTFFKIPTRESPIS
jgi:hypothetical protein